MTDFSVLCNSCVCVCVCVCVLLSPFFFLPFFPSCFFHSIFGVWSIGIWRGGVVRVSKFARVNKRHLKPAHIIVSFFLLQKIPKLQIFNRIRTGKIPIPEIPADVPNCEKKRQGKKRASSCLTDDHHPHPHSSRIGYTHTHTHNVLLYSWNDE